MTQFAFAIKEGRQYLKFVNIVQVYAEGSLVEQAHNTICEVSGKILVYGLFNGDFNIAEMYAFVDDLANAEVLLHQPKSTFKTIAESRCELAASLYTTARRLTAEYSLPHLGIRSLLLFHLPSSPALGSDTFALPLVPSNYQGMR